MTPLNSGNDPLQIATNIKMQAFSISKEMRSHALGQIPRVLWFTGLSGSGKSTIADIVERQLVANGRHTMLLDGDNMRHGLCKDLGFSPADRIENIRRVGEVAKLFVDAGLIVLACFISPYKNDRRMIRELFDEPEFVEVWIDTPIEVCESRDPKGLYKKARDGLILNFTGLSSPYEAPANPEIHIKTQYKTPNECALEIAAWIDTH